jgi:hypothetical protein
MSVCTPGVERHGVDDDFGEDQSVDLEVVYLVHDDRFQVTDVPNLAR